MLETNQEESGKSMGENERRSKLLDGIDDEEEEPAGN